MNWKANMAGSRWWQFLFNRFLGWTKIQIRKFWLWVAFITGLVLCQTNIALEDFVSLQDVSCISSILTAIVWPSPAISGHHESWWKRGWWQQSGLARRRLAADWLTGVAVLWPQHYCGHQSQDASNADQRWLLPLLTLLMDWQPLQIFSLLVEICWNWSQRQV